MTDNHNYNTPQKGTTDWHIPLNENFRSIDTDVEVRDIESNRSQYTPKDGAAFRATDTGNVFVGDGSSWNKLNPPADTSSGGPYTAGSVADIRSQAADTATEFVYIAPGTYNFDGRGAIEPSAGTTLYAEPGTVTIQGDGTTPTNEAVYVSNDRVEVYGLTIEGYRERHPSEVNQQNGIRVERASDVRISHCEVFHVTRNGVDIRSEKFGQRWGRIEVNNCWLHDIDNMGVNIYVDGGGDVVNDLFVRDNRIEYLGKNRDGSDRSLTTGATPPGSGIGVENSDGRGAVLSGNYVRMTAKEGIRANNSTCVGNVVVDWSQYGSENRSGIWTAALQQEGSTIANNVVRLTTKRGGPNPRGISVWTALNDAEIQGTTVSGNVVFNGASSDYETGIELIGNRVTIVGNRVRGFDRGIQIGNSGAGTSRANVVNSNSVDDATDGIMVRYDVADTMLLGNSATGCSRDGIWVSDSTNVTAAYNVLTGSSNGVSDRGSNSGLTTVGNI